MTTTSNTAGMTRMTCDECGGYVSSITFAADLPQDIFLVPCGHHSSVTFKPIEEK